MPYIKGKQRRYDLQIAPYAMQSIGELNFGITDLCNTWLRKTQKRYADYNAIIGALECAKQEFYRRMVAPYEDQKMRENGDVYQDETASQQ